MNTVRIGIIGCGNVARNRHLPGLQSVEDVMISRVWSRNPEKSRAFAEECGAKVSDSWEEVAEADDVDAVIIATPPALHAAATIQTLAAGKHVLSQARMARNVREACSMLQAAEKSSCITALYPPKPGLKGDRVVRRMLREKQLGEIREIRITGLASMLPSEKYQWTTDSEVVGVNMFIMGLWVEILNRWVGPAKSLSATAKCHIRERISSDGSRVAASVPDSVAVTAELQCGAVGSYHFSTCAVSGPGHRIEVFGSAAALAYQLYDEELFFAGQGEPWQTLTVDPADIRTQSTDAEFIAAIRGGPAVEPSFADGLAYMEFCEAVAYSAYFGKTVSLPLEEPLMDAWGKPVR